MNLFNTVKNNPQILEFIKQTEVSLAALSYTDHGLRHSKVVSDRAFQIAKAIGISEKEGELAAIAGFCHDMGNFLSRTYHHYLGAMLFHQVFSKEFNPQDLVLVLQAISNHDRNEMSFTNAVSALVVLADKSDVHRSRVITTALDKIKADIHDRVNFSTRSSSLNVDKKKKRITLTLKIDTNFTPIMEYFEIFTGRMVYCRRAAEYLGYNFGIVINKIRLL